MDDFALVADSKDDLREAHARVESYLGRVVDLRLKERATILAPVSQGLPFLGWRLYRGTRRLRPENARRTRRRLRARRWELRTGRIDGERYVDAVRSVLAHLEHGETRSWRRGSLQPVFAGETELGGGPQAPRTA